MRYAAMTRPWFAHTELQAVTNQLGRFTAGHAPAAHKLKPAVEIGPMGAMS